MTMQNTITKQGVRYVAPNELEAQCAWCYVMLNGPDKGKKKKALDQRLSHGACEPCANKVLENWKALKSLRLQGAQTVANFPQIV